MFVRHRSRDQHGLTPRNAPERVVKSSPVEGPVAYTDVREAVGVVRLQNHGVLVVGDIMRLLTRGGQHAGHPRDLGDDCVFQWRGAVAPAYERGHHHELRPKTFREARHQRSLEAPLECADEENDSDGGRDHRDSQPAKPWPTTKLRRGQTARWTECGQPDSLEKPSPPADEGRCKGARREDDEGCGEQTERWTLGR